MKNIYTILVLLFLSNSCFGETMLDIAEKKRYPAFLRQLRAKVLNYLKTKEIEMSIDIQALRSRNLWNESNFFEDQYFYTYQNIESKFDKEFERIDKKYNTISERLDDEEASDKEKAQLIDALKADATASINALMERYKN